MAIPLTADAQLAAFRAEGLTVVEHRSWRTHNRNSHGAWGPVNGIMIHHTVTHGATKAQTTDSVELCYNGRSDLPGPLCHGVIAKDGTVYMVGNGRANHAGGGDPRVLAAVHGEDYADRPAVPTKGNTDGIDGNHAFYGFECINLGDGRDPWPEVQLDAVARIGAAIIRAHRVRGDNWGTAAKAVIGHLEWSDDKIDPHGFSMKSMRARVAERLAHPESWNPGDDTDQQEDDVPSTLGKASSSVITVVPGKWKVLTFDGKPTLLTGATSYSALVQMTAKLPPGATVQGRFVHLRPDGSRWESGIVERTSTAGLSFLDFPHLGSIGAAEKLRFEYVYYPVDATDTASIAVDTSRIRGLWWK